MNKIKIIQCRFCQSGHPRTDEFFLFDRKTGHVRICKKRNIFNCLRYKKRVNRRLVESARKRIREALKAKGLKKEQTTMKSIGCSPDKLRRYLEGLFKPGMSWRNYGSEWHIDHIKPLALAKNMREIKKLSHFTNLQPLWAVENLKKGKKYVEIEHN